MKQFIRLGDHWLNVSHIQSATVKRRWLGRRCKVVIQLGDGFFSEKVSASFDTYEDAEYIAKELFSE